MSERRFLFEEYCQKAILELKIFLSCRVLPIVTENVFRGPRLFRFFNKNIVFRYPQEFSNGKIFFEKTSEKPFWNWRSSYRVEIGDLQMSLMTGRNFRGPKLLTFFKKNNIFKRSSGVLLLLESSSLTSRGRLQLVDISEIVEFFNTNTIFPATFRNSIWKGFHLENGRPSRGSRSLIIRFFSAIFRNFLKLWRSLLESPSLTEIIFFR